MHKLNRLTVWLFISIIAGSAFQCLNPRGTIINRRPAVRQSRLPHQPGEKNDYHLKIREFLNNIKYYIGTPYHYGGDSRQGMDCSGFVTVIFKQSFDIDLPHSAHQIYKDCQKIAPNELHLGDLVFFRMTKTKKIDHVGIYLVKNYFVHASSSYGVVVSELTEKYYRSRFAGAGRIINLEAARFDKQ